MEKIVTIKAPNFQTAEFRIKGDAPLVVHKFSTKARQQIKDAQESGNRAKSKRVREPKDFNALYEACRYRSKEGWDGVPAAAFRKAMISACKVTGYVMTRAKLSIFIVADGYDKECGTPLVRIHGTPQKHEDYVRLETGVTDIRIRPMWREWKSVLRVKYDADMLNEVDISNLVMRAGVQVGIVEGRPDSKNSAGCGWGTFIVEGKNESINRTKKNS